MPTENIDAVGKILAAQPEVTHCYERKRYDSFPYNMYAMVHCREPGGLEAIRLRISATAGLEGGAVLLSKREFKKASPRFFEEDL